MVSLFLRHFETAKSYLGMYICNYKLRAPRLLLTFWLKENTILDGISHCCKRL